MEVKVHILAQIGDQQYEGVATLVNSAYADTAKQIATDNKTVKINNTEVPLEIADLIHIAEGDGLYVVTKPWTPDKQDWIAINNFVKNLGGKWISAKRDSRWEIPKK